MKLDETDLKILKILQADGRITNTELAKRIGISPPPTLDRVRKLEKNGVIKKYVALLDTGSIGIETYTFVEATLNRHGRDSVLKFIDAIHKIDEVMECHHVTGDADFLLKIAVKNIPTYEDLVLHKLTDLPHILNLKTMVVLSTVKNETAFIIEEGGNNNEK